MGDESIVVLNVGVGGSRGKRAGFRDGVQPGSVHPKNGDISAATWWNGSDLQHNSCDFQPHVSASDLNRTV
jgi:hypothetical protein